MSTATPEPPPEPDEELPGDETIPDEEFMTPEEAANNDTVDVDETE
jgi:hypothetical protein